MTKNEETDGERTAKIGAPKHFAITCEEDGLSLLLDLAACRRALFSASDAISMRAAQFHVGESSQSVVRQKKIHW